MMKWCVQGHTAKFGRAVVSSCMVFHSVIFLSDLLWHSLWCFSRKVYKRNAFRFYYWVYFLSLLNKMILKHPLWFGKQMLLRSLMIPKRKKKKKEDDRKEFFNMELNCKFNSLLQWNVSRTYTSLKKTHNNYHILCLIEIQIDILVHLFCMAELEYWSVSETILKLNGVLWLIIILNYLNCIIHFFSNINTFFKTELAPPRKLCCFMKKSINYESDKRSLLCPLFTCICWLTLPHSSLY